MRDQALGVAEVVGDADQLQRIEEAEGRRLAALDLEGHDLRRPDICRVASAACG